MYKYSTVYSSVRVTFRTLPAARLLCPLHLAMPLDSLNGGGGGGGSAGVALYDSVSAGHYREKQESCNFVINLIGNNSFFWKGILLKSQQMFQCMDPAELAFPR